MHVGANDPYLRDAQTLKISAIQVWRRRRHAAAGVVRVTLAAPREVCVGGPLLPVSTAPSGSSIVAGHAFQSPRFAALAPRAARMSEPE